MSFTENIQNTINVLIKGARLSEIEEDILDNYFKGFIDAEIGENLKITKQQVRGKRQNIYAKIGYQVILMNKMLNDKDMIKILEGKNDRNKT